MPLKPGHRFGVYASNFCPVLFLCIIVHQFIYNYSKIINRIKGSTARLAAGCPRGVLQMSFKGLVPGPGDFAGYIYGLRWYILFIILLFLFFTATGMGIAVFSPAFTNSTISSFQEEVAPLKEASAFSLMLGIFSNNAIKCFFALALGPALGIAPLLFIIANGFVIGIIVGATIAKAGLFYVIVGIVPHGVIEMPMVFISSAIGLKLGVDVIKTAARKNTHLFRDIKEALLIFVFWIIPLLFIAAFLETFVTGALLYALFSKG